MGSHPINLAIRFLLEITALMAIGFWAWRQGEGWIRFVLAIGVPIVIAAIWGIFAVPDDPSRSGSAPVVVGGIIRLVIELSIFAFATWSLSDLGFTRFAWVFALTVSAHYIISCDRILWLINH